MYTMNAEIALKPEQVAANRYLSQLDADRIRALDPKLWEAIEGMIRDAYETGYIDRGSAS